MIKVRQGTFETNSSSTHSITMCMESDFKKWKNGEMYWDRWNDSLISKDEVEKENDEEWKEKLEDYIEDYSDYYTYEDFNNLEYETYEDTFKTPNGEEVIAFGYYGYD